jgi:hypothetical protein
MLSGINTEGLSKTQKKKLKKKMKKEQELNKDDSAQKKEHDLDEEDGDSNKDSQNIKGNDRAKATADQMMMMNENEEDL